MYQEERLLAILKLLKEQGRVSVRELCDRFGISRDTARRDLVRLDEQGVILRTRGGAILRKLSGEVKSYKERLEAEPAGKREIGRIAAALVRPGEHLIMDASTTVQAAASFLEGEGITVVTNSIDIADILVDREGVTVHLLGGRLHPRHRYVFGSTTVDQLRNYRVDRVFLGAGGVTGEGLFYPSEEDGSVIRETIRCASEVVVLADATKFDKRFFFRVCGWEDVDLLVTDRKPDQALLESICQAGVEVKGWEKE
ncbi:DeoR family transcriptional regulator [Melghirimyces profundicolus]|uniref:DeoR family transcriptional regulator n=1 Tax=Melghirimyces profundicolus TaxID=1242148 RepID=A0A2T6C909_9BACL|nr:DeoR family transcriptional regulator [Melghirimyces profundicolus]